MELTKSDALRAYATMINTLDASHIEPLLAEDFHYASQMVFEELTSKQAFLTYIRAKLKTIKKTGDFAYAEMAECPVVAYTDSIGPCVVVAQYSKENLRGTVFVKVKDGYIKRLDMCRVPHPSVAIRSGEYPPGQTKP
jgi:hypothetical protein